MFDLFFLYVKEIVMLYKYINININFVNNKLSFYFLYICAIIWEGSSSKAFSRYRPAFSCSPSPR